MLQKLLQMLCLEMQVNKSSLSYVCKLRYFDVSVYLEAV